MKTLRTKIFLFVSLLLLLPAVPLSVLIMELLDKSYAIGVNERVEQALEDGIRVSARYYQLKKKEFGTFLEGVPGQYEGAKSFLRQRLTENFEGASYSVFATVKEALAGTAISKDINEKYKKPLPNPMIWPSPDRSTLYALLRLENGGLARIDYPLGEEFRSATKNIQEVNQIYKTLGVVKQDIRKSFLFTFLLIYGSGVLIALLVSFLISRKITRPIENLTAATSAVASGDLKHRIDLGDRDEFGVLASAFNHMVEELDRNQRQIIELEKMAGWQQMARRLAHEIKNPLTPIQLMAQQIVDKYSGDDESYQTMLRDSYEIIEQEVESLKKLVRAFSDFARLPDFQKAENDLRQLLLSIQKLYVRQVTVNIPEESIEFVFDYDYLRRALINLIDNALAAGGSVEGTVLEVSDVAGNIVISVSDDGRGMDADALQKIYEPYYSTKQSGVGLGLAIVKKIVEEHGGRIEVASEKAKGTRFTISLPSDSGDDIAGRSKE